MRRPLVLPTALLTFATTLAAAPALGAEAVPRARKEDAHVRLEVKLEGSRVAVGPSELFATVDVRAKVWAEHPEAATRATRPPVGLVLAVERSAAMAGAKLGQAKAAARELVRSLQPEDQLAILDFGEDTRVLKAMPASAANRKEMLGFIDRISARGPANLGAALTAAVDLASPLPTRHVILISTGRRGAGPTLPAELLALAARAGKRSVPVSTVGVGEDFDAPLLQGIAGASGGNFSDLSRAEAVGDVFRAELDQVIRTAAHNTSLWLQPATGTEILEVIGYPVSVQSGQVSVALRDLSGGTGIRMVVRLRVIGKADGAVQDVLQARVAYLRARKDDPEKVDTAVVQELKVSAKASARADEVKGSRDAQLGREAARSLAAREVARTAATTSHAPPEAPAKPKGRLEY